MLFSTDVVLDAMALYRYDKSHFQSEFLFHNIKQFSGLIDGQACAKAKLDFHFNTSLTAGSLATLDARRRQGDTHPSFSMASLKQRALNQHRPTKEENHGRERYQH